MATRRWTPVILPTSPLSLPDGAPARPAPRMRFAEENRRFGRRFAPVIRPLPKHDIYNDRAVQEFKRLKPPISTLLAHESCSAVLEQIPADQLDARVPEIYEAMRDVNPLLPPVSFTTGATRPGAKFANMCQLKQRLSRMRPKWNDDVDSNGRSAYEITYMAWLASADHHPEAVLHRYLFYLKHGVTCYNAYSFAQNLAKPVYSAALAQAASKLDPRLELPAYITISMAKWPTSRLMAYRRLVSQRMPPIVAFEVGKSSPDDGPSQRFAKNTKADFDLVDPIHTAEFFLSWATRMSADV